jgi:diguanylate cyclase (GGDEF)-like protein
MSRRISLSIFAHAADRGTNVAYFLGAVVPLFVLGIVIERYILAPFQPGREEVLNLGAPAALGLFVSIGTLSFACFLVLRRLVQRTIAENRSLALYDSLTGLPNRRKYHERLEKAIARAEWTGELVANCFIDLDGFKHVNDTLGHRAGDQLLMQVARRLLGVVRPGDWVGRPTVDANAADVPVSRLGGDEFTLILSGKEIDQNVSRVARRVLEALNKPFSIDGQEVRVTASIGIAVYPNDGQDVDSLLRNADIAMYSAKKQGRNGYQFYSSSMNEEAEHKIELERRLRRAIANEEFILHFQPVRETATGETRAAEALIRWRDPDLGLISPDDFIPVAEDTGLIIAIGSWVLRAACEQARRWQTDGFKPLRIAVNVSGHQLRKQDFVREVEATLRETGLSPHDLELEITESTIMQEDEVTDRAFLELHELGVSVALDDFGTGYSSLSYLRRFRIDRLKIDRSFVARIPDDAEDMAVTAAIVAMAHQLLLPVVGEGVETMEQAQSLSEIGCDELQGYLFSRPLPASEFERFLTREKDDEVD